MTSMVIDITETSIDKMSLTECVKISIDQANKLLPPDSDYIWKIKLSNMITDTECYCISKQDETNKYLYDSKLSFGSWEDYYDFIISF